MSWHHHDLYLRSCFEKELFNKLWPIWAKLLFPQAGPLAAAVVMRAENPLPFRQAPGALLQHPRAPRGCWAVVGDGAHPLRRRVLPSRGSSNSGSVRCQLNGSIPAGGHSPLLGAGFAAETFLEAKGQGCDARGHRMPHPSGPHGLRGEVGREPSKAEGDEHHGYPQHPARC